MVVRITDKGNNVELRKLSLPRSYGWRSGSVRSLGKKAQGRGRRAQGVLHTTCYLLDLNWYDLVAANAAIAHRNQLV